MGVPPSAKAPGEQVLAALPGQVLGRGKNRRTVRCDGENTRSVEDKLAELEQSGQDPGALGALRWVLAQHQPTSAGRCRTCRRAIWRRPAFPCMVCHQIRFHLLARLAGADRHRQPAGQGSTPGPSGSGTAPTTATMGTGGR